MKNARIVGGLIGIALGLLTIDSPLLAQAQRGSEALADRSGGNASCIQTPGVNLIPTLEHDGSTRVTLQPSIFRDEHQLPRATGASYQQPADYPTTQQKPVDWIKMERIGPNPLHPINAGRSAGQRLNANSVKHVRLTDGQRYLNSNSVKYADPNKFLKNSPSGNDRQSPVPGKARITRMASSRNSFRRQQDNGPSYLPQRNPSNAAQQTVSDDDRYLTVADVYEPISLIPFAEIRQSDPRGLLANEIQIPLPVLQPRSYPELTGQYFQPHFASWTAHHFYHSPLLFEEVNLERYGNELRHQNIVSAAHFFGSAALLPYKLGQAHGHECITTLGYYRPGECVPFQHHRLPLSGKGLLLQGLLVTGLAL